MKNIVAGTAGHIDHGKTALVRALTGIDTDRLKEEKERGISIDLGFAHLDLQRDLRLAFVDVPGHERFIKNMLAGVGGIDLVLFVIAADESIKPQTREHFEICRLLEIPRGIVVLTKADLVDDDILALVRLEVEEFVRGSFLEGAPVIAVSSKAGTGLDDLKAELVRLAEVTPVKDATRYFRLPIDRAFSLHGFGTVVTGTLLSGAVAAETEVELLPGRKRVRVRGVQVHGRTSMRALAGQRTALNLAGIETSEVGRGMTLAEAGRFAPVRTIDAAFELLGSAKTLKHRSPVHFHAGTAEVEATIRRLDAAGPLSAGERYFVRLQLREPLLLLPGDRFIVRMFSPVVTVGGGVVLDIAPPQRVRPERARRLQSATASERIALLVGESNGGMSMSALIARTGLLEREIRAGAAHARLTVVQEPLFWALNPVWVKARVEAFAEHLRRFHREHPLLSGMSKEELRSRELPGLPNFLVDTVLAQGKTIVASGDVVHLASHRVAMKQDESEATARIEKAFENAGLAVPALGEVLARSGVEGARAKTLLQILIRDKRLIRVNEDLVFHPVVIGQLRASLALRKGQRFGVPDFKDWTGISRKYAIPLLEFLDRERVTRREGEMRVVL